MKKFFNEFRTFISRGNVMDLAVGVIIGAAFTSIVNSLVDDIIMPIIGALTGGIDFKDWFVEIGTAKITYGNFIGAVINFVLIALVIFMMVKLMNKMSDMNPLNKKAVEAEPEPPRLCQYCKMEVAADATRCPHCTAIIIPGDDAIHTDYGEPGNI